jgi:hypothetical protein
MDGLFGSAKNGVWDTPKSNLFQTGMVSTADPQPWPEPDRQPRFREADCFDTAFHDAF